MRKRGRHETVSYVGGKRVKIQDSEMLLEDDRMEVEEMELSEDKAENKAENKAEDKADDKAEDKAEVEEEGVRAEEEWEVVDSLPAGWTCKKLKLKSSHTGLDKVTHIKDPQGKFYQCRRLALRHMVEAGVEEDEVEIMRSMLDFEGWQASALLPEGWRYKTDGNTIDRSLVFLSKDVTLLKGITKAMAHMKTEESTSKTDLANIRAIHEEHSRAIREHCFDWRESEGLPEGWKDRVTDTGKVFLLAPNGETQLVGRRAALQYMVQQGHREEDRAMMRAAMEADGWLQSSYLPSGWLYKLSHGEKVALVAREGEHFHSYRRAMDYMGASEAYTEEDIRGVTRLVEELSSSRRSQSSQFKEREGLPAGWRSRVTASGREFIISPAGRQFLGQRQALAHMVAEGGAEEVVAMRAYMARAGWEASPHLPEGWIYQTRTNRLEDKRIISREGIHFTSYSSAKQFLANNENYNETDLENLSHLANERASDNRKVQQEWEEKEGLPHGWKVKLSQGGKKYFLTPDAQSLIGSRAALQHMIKNHFSPSDVEAMKKVMEDDGWIRSEHLPAGWIYRDTSRSSTTGTQIISQEGVVFESQISAREYMESSEAFTATDMEKFDLFSEEKSSRRRMNQQEWEEKEGLPQGWKVKLSQGGNRYFLTPGGQSLIGSRVALQHMIKNQFSPCDVEAMKKVMEDDGWIRSEHLPAGWIYRDTSRSSTTGNQIISHDGVVFESQTSAREYMESSEAFTATDMEKFDLFSGEKASQRRMKQQDWEDKEGLPAGWRMMVTPSGQRHFLTPGGLRTAGRRATLQFMVRQGHSEEEVAAMRRFMEEDGWTDGWKDDWEEDEALPAGWKTKVAPSGQKFFLTPEGQSMTGWRKALQHMIGQQRAESEVAIMRKAMEQDGWATSDNLPEGWIYRTNKQASKEGVLFLSKDGLLFKSHTTVKEFMESSPNFDEVDVSRLSLMKEELSSMRRKGQQDWEEKGLLPQGWKVKVSPGGQKHLLTPQGHRIAGMRGALQYMVKEGYSQEDIQAMRRCMEEEDGWTPSPHLPEGWIFKDTSSAESSGVKILSREGLLFESYLTAKEFLQSTTDYSPEHLASFALLSEKAGNIRRKAQQDWTASTELPPGWKIRMGPGGKKFFLSPAGQSMAGRRAVLHTMIQERCKEEEVEMVRASMEEDGWRRSQHLPTGWLVRDLSTASNHSIQILSASAILFSSYLSAKEFMEATEGFNQSDLTNINKLMEENANIRRKSQEDWDANDSLPSGWKMKTTGSEKKLLLSPDGKQFTGRKLALQHMIKDKYEDIDIEKMQSGMSEDGWQRSEFLPAGWLYKDLATSSASGVHILSRNGLEFDSYLAAKEFMKLSKHFGDADIANIDSLVRSNGNKRRQLVRQKITSLTNGQENNASKPTQEDGSGLTDNWVGAKGLPAGWTTKQHSVNSFYLSPSGEQFVGKRALFQHFVTSKAPKDQVKPIMEIMKEDGWKTSKFLPRNWMYKTDNFLTCNGKVVRGFTEAKTVLAAIYGSDQKYINNFELFKNLRSGEKRNENYNWNEDDSTIPGGWKSRVVGGGSRVFFLSPDNQQFGNRLTIVKHMEETGNYSSEEKDKVRMSLELEGWLEDPALPNGWRYKKKGQGGKSTDTIAIVRTSGEVVEGTTAAWRLVTEGGMPEEDSITLRVFLETLAASQRAEKYEWVEGDATVPEGWKTRMAQQKMFMLSPDGQMFSSRRAALQHMVREHFAMEEVATMRALLGHEGWQASQHLPNNWRMRRSKKGARQSYTFITGEGEELRSIKLAVEFLTRQGPSGREAATRLARVSTSPARPPAGPGQARGHLLKKASPGRQKAPVRAGGEEREWVVDSTVPEGWRYRRVHKPGVGEVEVFLTVDSRQVYGRHAAMARLVQEGRGEQVEVLRSGLVAQGWRQDPALPTHYMVREVGGSVEYTCPDARRVEGHARLLELLLTYGQAEAAREVVGRVAWATVPPTTKLRIKGLLERELGLHL